MSTCKVASSTYKYLQSIYQSITNYFQVYPSRSKYLEIFLNCFLNVDEYSKADGKQLKTKDILNEMQSSSRETLLLYLFVMCGRKINEYKKIVKALCVNFDKIVLNES